MKVTEERITEVIMVTWPVTAAVEGKTSMSTNYYCAKVNCSFSVCPSFLPHNGSLLYPLYVVIHLSFVYLCVYKHKCIHVPSVLAPDATRLCG